MDSRKYDLSNGLILEITNPNILFLSPDLLDENEEIIRSYHSQTITEYLESLEIEDGGINLYGAIDRYGHLVIDYRFDYLEKFNGITAKARIGNVWGEIDGLMLLDPKYSGDYFLVTEEDYKRSTEYTTSTNWFAWGMAKRIHNSIGVNGVIETVRKYTAKGLAENLFYCYEVSNGVFYPVGFIDKKSDVINPKLTRHLSDPNIIRYRL